MTDHPLLEQDYVIDTPESVAFTYEVTGIGNRFIAALIDSAVLGVALFLLNLLVLVALDGTQSFRKMVEALTFFESNTTKLSFMRIL